MRLLETLVVVISPDHNEKYKARKAWTCELLARVGFQRVEHFRSGTEAYPRCLVNATIDILSQHLDEPLLIVEDDIDVEPEFGPIADYVPDPAADAIYLGNSRCQARRDADLCVEPALEPQWTAHNDRYIRILNMLSAHAILYQSKAYKAAVIQRLRENPGVYNDISMARLHPQFLILAHRIPLFYQAARLNPGNEAVERITRFQLPEPNDRLGYCNGNLETNGELDLIRRTLEADMIVFDVGANVGDWSAAALAHCPGIQLHAFEPHPDAAQQFRQRFPAVILSQLALSNSNGQQQLYCWSGNGALNGLHNRPVLESLLRQRASTLAIQCNTLDNYCEQHGIDNIGLLKIDTEGNELAVLQGAGRLLQRGAISVIQLEYGGTYPDAGISLQQVFTLLSSHDYRLARLIQGGEIPTPHWRQALETHQYCNYVARRR